MSRSGKGALHTQRTNAVGRPPAVDLTLLAVAVLASSTTGPLIALCAAPGIAIAFWRTFAGSAVMAPVAWLAQRSDFALLTRRHWRLIALSGVLLALHFALWIPSIGYTTVASSTALVATQPIWAAVIARLRGHHIPRLTWIGIGIALAGVVLLGGSDFAFASSTALFGDFLALLGAITAGAYVTVGQAVRVRIGNHVYTTLCYGFAAVTLLVIAIAFGVPLSGWSGRDWLLIGAITVTGQLLGHTLMNRVLATTSATVASMAILFEMPGSTLLAAWWVNQVPPTEVWPAIALVLVGLVVVIRSGSAD